MARKVSPARVKTHRIYTPWEAAEALGVHRQTVRRWIRDKGLAADRTTRPWLIEGRALKAFLGQRRSDARCKLALHHCYCLGCKGPREPDGRFAYYTQLSSTNGMLSALCPTCGNGMNKVVRRADLDAIRAKIEVTIEQASPRLVSRADPPLNVTLETEDLTRAKNQT